MKRSALIILFGVLVGCASMSGTEITESNNRIQLPHFSFVVPADQGWRLSNPLEDVESVFVVKRFGLRTLQMEITRIPVRDERRRAWSANQMGDDVRNMWKQDITKNGALLEVTMGNEFVGGKRYYTMYYVTSRSTRLFRGWQYVYIPKEENNDYFIYALYSEGTPISLPFTRKSYAKEEFLETLKTLQVNQ